MKLDPHLQNILESEPFPAFSPEEMERRRRLVAGVMSGVGVGHALLYGAQRSGSAVPWLTGWPVIGELVRVTDRGVESLHQAQRGLQQTVGTDRSGV